MNRAIEIILALTIVGATLAFGGVQTITFSIMEVVVFALMFAVLVQQTRQGEIRLPLPIWTALFAALVVVQLVPLPPSLVGALSPNRVPDLKLVPQAAWAAFSVYPHGTLLNLVKFLAYLSAFALAAFVSDFRKGRSVLVRTLILLGFLEATYGIVQYLTGWQKIFTYAKIYDLEEATGTYINRNHYAGLLEMVLPFVVAAAFYSFQVWSSHRHAYGEGREAEERTSAAYQTLFYSFLLVIMMVAVIFSRSRMGILGAILSIVIVAGLAQVRVRRKAWLLGVAFFVACALGYGLWIGLGPVLARYEGMSDPSNLRIEGRFMIWRDTLQMIRDYPLFGTGLGTFELVYRHYQTGMVTMNVENTHNDFLQFAAETGLPGATLLFLPIIYLLIKMIGSFLDDPRSYRRSVTLGCIGSTTALLLHSLTDFNLQLPANALIFAVVLGLGYRVVYIERGSSRDEDSRP